MRPWLSVAGTRCTRCTPDFVFQPREHVAAGDLGDALLEAAQLGVVVFEDLEAPAAARRRIAGTSRTARPRTARPRRRPRRGGFPGWRNARRPRRFGSSASRISCCSVGMRSFSAVQLGLGELAHLRVGEQGFGLCLGAARRRAARRRARRAARCRTAPWMPRIGLAGQALAQHRAQFVGAATIRSSLREKLIAAARQLRQRRPPAARRLPRSLSCATPRATSVSPEDDGGPRADAVGALHAALDVAAIGHLGADAGVAERLQHLDRRALRPPRPPGTTATGADGAGAVRPAASPGARCPRPSRRRASAGRPFPRPARHTARPPSRCPARRGGRSRTRTRCGCSSRARARCADSRTNGTANCAQISLERRVEGGRLFRQIRDGWPARRRRCACRARPCCRGCASGCARAASGCPPTAPSLRAEK